MPEFSGSILTDVKDQLGIDESCEDFDQNILAQINGAIFNLRQLGVGPKKGFLVTSKEQTYSDYLGDEQSLEYPDVRLYLFYKTKLGFDPPTSGSVLEVIKQMILEIEWRLNAQVDPPGIFD